MTSMDTIARTRSGFRRLAGAPLAVAALALAAACSSSSSSATDSGTTGADGSTAGGMGGVICQYTLMPQTAAPATCASPGGALPEANNGHCGSGASAQVQATGMCETGAVSGDDGSSSAPASDAAATGDDAGSGVDAGNDGTCGESDYGPTNFGTSASDDDCKYDVSWTSTPVCENGNVYFTVTAKRRAGLDGGASLSDEPPLTGASVSAEVYYNDCATIAPNSGQATSELGNGAYKVGPIQFSKSGKWVVRFHFNECCSDDPVDSPHGHAAFWINVP